MNTLLLPVLSIGATTTDENLLLTPFNNSSIFSSNATN
jgi:hypothetical protein